MVEALVISTPDCRLCERARTILGRLAETYPLELRELGWDDPDAQSRLREDGVPFPPAVYLDGRLAAYGRLSEGAVRKRLEALAR